MAHGLQGFPQSSYYGKSRKGNAPATPKKLNTFEDEYEYQKFIGELKAKKEAQNQEEVAPVIPETPVVEETPIIPETVVPADAPILNETTTKKSRKKKTETVVETPVEE